VSPPDRLSRRGYGQQYRRKVSIAMSLSAQSRPVRSSRTHGETTAGASNSVSIAVGRPTVPERHGSRSMTSGPAGPRSPRPNGTMPSSSPSISSPNANRPPAPGFVLPGRKRREVYTVAEIAITTLARLDTERRAILASQPEEGAKDRHQDQSHRADARGSRHRKPDRRRP
jgi:hypothetical protein